MLSGTHPVPVAKIFDHAVSCYWVDTNCADLKWGQAVLVFNFDQLRFIQLSMSAPGALSSLFHDNPVTLAEVFHSRAGGQNLECALISSDGGRLLRTECRLERWLARVYTLDLIYVGRIQRRSEQAEINLSTMGRGDGVLVKPG